MTAEVAAVEFGVPDEHGDFRYTLRQFLLMFRLHKGGDWTDVVAAVGRELRDNEWDPDELKTYDQHRSWYLLNRKTM